MADTGTIQRNQESRAPVTIPARRGPVSAPFRALLPVAALAFVCAACSGPSRLARDARPEGFPNHAPSEILRNVRAALPESLDTFAATASLSARSPVFAGNLTARIAHRRGDSLYVSLSSAPLGIEAARILATPDSIFHYDRLAQTLAAGTLDAAAAALPFPLTGDAAFRMFLGLVAPDSSVAWQVNADSLHYQLRSEDGRQRWIIDPALWRVVLREWRTADGSLSEALSYSDFDDVGGVMLPRRVVVRSPERGVSLSLRYRTIALNPSDLSMRLRVPGDIVRIRWGGGR